MDHTNYYEMLTKTIKKYFSKKAIVGKSLLAPFGVAHSQHLNGAAIKIETFFSLEHKYETSQLETQTSHKRQYLGLFGTTPNVTFSTE